MIGRISMDVKIVRNPSKRCYVMSEDKVLKQQDLSDDAFKELMAELSGDNIEILRTATKLFKVKSYKFKDVR